MKTREQNGSKQTNGNRAIWLVYRTDTNTLGFWLVKRTLGWKNFKPENFLQINRYFALMSYYNTIGQSNNSFFILRCSLAGKRSGHVSIFSFIGWYNKFRLLRLQRLDAIQIAYEKSLAARSKEKRLYSQDTIQTEPSFLLFTQESENEAPLARNADTLVIKFSKYLI